MSAVGAAVVVTGAGNGIGAATVAELARRGARVLAVDLDEASLEQVADGGSGEVIPHVADVTWAEAVQGMVAAAVERFGTIDALFNNAGILGATAPVTDYPDDVFERVFQVNVRGAFYGMKYAIPVMRDAGRGAIVNTASTGALVAAPEQSAYVASKHALLGLTRSVALELAKDHITVNALCPGPTDTPMLAEVMAGWSADDDAAIQAVLESVTPTARMGRPEEIACVATWLLLDAPEFMTGVPITVDGAQTAR